MESEDIAKRPRGQGRGSNFMALGRDTLERVWQAPTTNRLNLLTAFLVLLAGTGSDHRLTKWSARACEDYAGLGKPRAKHAIEELISAGIVRRTETSSMLKPQYELPSLARDEDPIFLPVALVTGVAGETPVLRRIRETGDVMLLRMLIDLYGLIAVDVTMGVPIQCLYGGRVADGEVASRKLASVGAHAVWSLSRGTWRAGAGDWASRHSERANGKVSWDAFWNRVDLLKQVGAVFYETWVYDSENLDAEPLLPLDLSGLYGIADPEPEAVLTRAAFDASRALLTGREYVMDSAGGDFFLPMTLHRQPPVLRDVLRFRIEADTPGKRLAWRRRRALVEQQTSALKRLAQDAEVGQFDRPMRLSPAADAL